MRLTKNADRYIFHCDYNELVGNERAYFLPKRAGFAWAPGEQKWWTLDARKALKLAAYADDALRTELLGAAHGLPDPDKATLKLEGNTWQYFSPPALNSYPKQAGFKVAKHPFFHWITEDVGAALKLYLAASQAIPDDFVCPAEAQAVLAAERARRAAAVVGSRSIAAAADALPEYAVPDPAKGFELLPCQVAAVLYAKDRNVVIFGDEMRIGKSPESICWANCHRDVKRVLIIAKKTIKLNWLREWQRWSTLGLSVGVAWGLSDWPDTDVVIANAQILGHPKDKMIVPVLLKSGKQKMKKTKKGNVPATKKVYRMRPEILAVSWDMVIVDECHDFKTIDTARHQYLNALQPPKRALLTGTLSPNGRAMEIWPALNWIDPEMFPEKDRFKFALKFAGAKRGPFGWDLSGATNLDELQSILRSKYMVRRLFSEVFSEFPKRRRQLIEFPCPDDGFINEQDRLWKRYTDIGAKVREAVGDSDVTVDVTEHHEDVRELRSDRLACFEEMSRIRHEDAIKRIPFIVEHLKELLEETPKAVCFVWHNDVVEQIAAEFPGCVVIYGKTPGNQRVAMQDRFNAMPTGLAILGIAICEGLDMSSASVGVMAEWSWVPKDINQAEARLENPFKNESSLIQYCAFQGSLDAHMANMVVDKEEINFSALDKELVAMAEFRAVSPTGDEIALPEKREATGPVDAAMASDSLGNLMSTNETPNKKPGPVDGNGHVLSEADCQAIHAAVRTIAARCDGALAHDSVGFNAIDSRWGHTLAACQRLTPLQAASALKMLRKYDQQLNGQLERFYQ